MSSRLCPESLKIIKRSMFFSFLPVFDNLNPCFPSSTNPEESIQLEQDPELLSTALTHVRYLSFFFFFDGIEAERNKSRKIRSEYHGVKMKHH